MGKYGEPELGGGGSTIRNWLIKFHKTNSPAAARIHVSQKDENVVENFQMHEHPDRWGERDGDGESEPVRSLQTLEWWRGNWATAWNFQNSRRGLWNGAALVPTRDNLLN